jgi:hypothetical protein
VCMVMMMRMQSDHKEISRGCAGVVTLALGNLGGLHCKHYTNH